jgi:hypothetical protein
MCVVSGIRVTHPEPMGRCHHPSPLLLSPLHFRKDKTNKATRWVGVEALRSWLPAVRPLNIYGFHEPYVDVETEAVRAGEAGLIPADTQQLNY